jgi:hypothetical protein
MKVRDLLKAVKAAKKQYKDFLDFDIYTEQLKEYDKKGKRKEMVKDSEDWEYFPCFGYNTIFEKEKIFTINVNY